jgi:beta-lactamase superfamily II metal-dependent hydrolase
MVAHFIDVGQGDATLLEFPCGAILIDTGAQDNNYVSDLINYLNSFFNRRTDLNRTIETIFITHNHQDHTMGLKKIVLAFNVKRIVHNGKVGSNGTGNLCWAIRNKDKYKLSIESVTYDKVTSSGNKSGYTDLLVDPIICETCDPKIEILSGGFKKNPGWNAGDYSTPNNHSLVIRVDFGESSFLFTGDLEAKAIEKVLKYYDSGLTSHNRIFDVDVYRVGHHGSKNATTVELLDAMTPELAIISVGIWNSGQGSKGGRTAYSFGHPRKETIDFLSLSIAKLRNSPILAKVATDVREFMDYEIKKAIYATAWDKDIKLTAWLDGRIKIASDH